LTPSPPPSPQWGEGKGEGKFQIFLISIRYHMIFFVSFKPSLLTLLWSFEIHKVIQEENLTVAKERIEKPRQSLDFGVIGERRNEKDG
jgi:hypothetical protein